MKTRSSAHFITRLMPAQGIDFRTMIHRIYTGEEPGDRRNCHVNSSEQIPLAGTRMQVQNPRSPLHPVGPAAACLSCHTGMDAASQAAAHTTKLGESFAACHGSDYEFSVSRVHAR